MSYSQAPPVYSGSQPKGYQSVSQSENSSQPGDSNPFESDQPRTEGDADPEDFKFGVTVEQASIEIRQMFLRKVYTVLFIQLLGTTIVGGIMSTAKVSAWVQANQWAFIVPMIGSLVSMGFLYWKRHSHPTNLVLLGLFTLLESLSIGAVISYTDQTVVLQAAIITTFAFLGLTLFTLQSKMDFSSMGPYLFGGLMTLVGAGFIQMFLPFSQVTDLVFAGLGCIVFCGYIIYDTNMIQKRLSPDEWVMATISLYLDILNLFLNIVRILNGVHRD